MSLGGVSEPFSSNPPPAYTPSYTPVGGEDQGQDIGSVPNVRESGWMGVNTVGFLTSTIFVGLTIGSAVAAATVVNEVAMVVFAIVAVLFGFAAMASMGAACEEENLTLEQFFMDMKSRFLNLLVPFCSQLVQESGKAVITGAGQRLTDKISGRAGININ